MKTAVSIPDAIFERAERFAKQSRRTRSEIYAAALDEYVARHSPDEVTDAMNRICEQVSEEADDFVSTAGRRILGNVEW